VLDTAILAIASALAAVGIGGLIFDEAVLVARGEAGFEKHGRRFIYTVY
jgi:hypothetical protein